MKPKNKIVTADFNLEKLKHHEDRDESIDDGIIGRIQEQLGVRI